MHPSIQAGSADPDCLHSIFDYRMGISISGYRGKIQYPDFRISINNPTLDRQIPV